MEKDNRDVFELLEKIASRLDKQCEDLAEVKKRLVRYEGQSAKVLFSATKQMLGDFAKAKRATRSADSEAKKPDRNTLYCSFCGNSQHEVLKLIAGPTVFICDECTLLCMKILVDEVDPGNSSQSKDGDANSL